MPIDHAYIGREYPPIYYEVGREKIREYARAVGDLNPLYLDDEVGRNGPFGDIIAPPAMASQFTLLPSDQLFTDPTLGVDYQMLVHAEQEYHFCAPVRPGDVLVVKGRIKDIYEKRTLQFLIWETEVVNQRGENVVTGTATMVIRPRPKQES